jgi:hypothetical protein
VRKPPKLLRSKNPKKGQPLFKAFMKAVDKEKAEAARKGH